MKYSLTILPDAEKDIESAYLWYEEKRTGLGNDFLLSLEAGFELIAREPFIFKEDYKETRKHLIKRFPYKIIFLIKDADILILAVLHGKRNPGLLKDRV